MPVNATPTLAPARPDDIETALPALVDLLQACVAGGASIGWPHTPDAEVAAAFWRRCAAAVAAGERQVWLALERAGDPRSVQGSAQLLLDMPPNGRHRADIAKVMVHPRARRMGLAGALMHTLETQALDQGRSLLVLDTLEGSDAQRLYTRRGYQRCGRIPAYAVVGDGSAEATMVMFKRLGPGGLQVRPAAVDDPEARAVQAALSADLQARFGSTGEAGFARFDPAEDQFVLACDLDGRAVGCGALLALPDRPRCGEVKRLYAVEPGQGIGRQLMDFLEHEARLQGWREVALSTRRANTGALGFYQRLGYRPVEPWARYAGRADSVCLARRLD